MSNVCSVINPSHKMRLRRNARSNRNHRVNRRNLVALTFWRPILICAPLHTSSTLKMLGSWTHTTDHHNVPNIAIFFRNSHGTTVAYWYTICFEEGRPALANGRLTPMQDALDRPNSSLSNNPELTTVGANVQISFSKFCWDSLQVMHTSVN